MSRTFTLLLALGVAVNAALAAETADPNSARLRDALRSTTAQLRSAEAERATLQSAKDALAEENKATTARLEALKKEVAAERTAADKAQADLKTKLAAVESDLARVTATAAKWEASHQEAATLATSKETERAKLAAENVALQRLVADREAKNLALFKIANEVLTRYEKFSLGEAIAAREPFVGATRTKLENLVQDFQDKIAEQRVKR